MARSSTSMYLLHEALILELAAQLIIPAFLERQGGPIVFCSCTTFVGAFAAIGGVYGTCVPICTAPGRNHGCSILADRTRGQRSRQRSPNHCGCAIGHRG